MSHKTEQIGKYRIHTAETEEGIDLSLSLSGRMVQPNGFPELRKMPLIGAFKDGYVHFCSVEDVAEVKDYLKNLQ